MKEAVHIDKVLLYPDRKDYAFLNLNPLVQHQSIVIGISKYGKGIFARQKILKGQLIAIISGKIIEFDEAVLLGEKESYPLQVGLSEYIVPYKNDTWQFINHSCDPNCGVNEKFEIIAIKNIKKGEEIFYDYSTSMLERHWTMKCNCNSKNCRQIISDFDTLLPERQKYYLKKGVVQKFIKTYLSHRDV